MSAPDDPYNGFYNGFSMAERRATTPLLRKARAEGLLAAPTVCSICGFIQSTVSPSRFEYHAEDYREPLKLYAICHNCHLTLHARFKQPQRWARLIARYPDVDWVQKLTVDPASRGLQFDETYPDGVPHP